MRAVRTSSEAHHSQYQSNSITNSLPSLYKSCDDRYSEILTVVFAAEHWQTAQENLAPKEYVSVFFEFLAARGVGTVNTFYPSKLMLLILWEILTAGQKLLNKNVLQRDLQSNQSSKANIILATAETTRGAWEKKKCYYQGSGSCFQLHGWMSSLSLRNHLRWESPQSPRCGGRKTGPLFSGVVLLLLTRPQSR